MGFVKWLISRVEGKQPTVEQMDTESLTWNERDGKLYGKKVSETGVEEIIEISGKGGGGGATTFLDLTDTPASYTGNAGKGTRVNSGENGIEFFDLPAAGDSLKLDPATATFEGLKVQLFAGEALSKGHPCYMSASKMYRGDADAVATAFCFAIATDTMEADAVGLFLLIGIIGGYTGLTVGAPVYLSTAIGALSQALPSGSNDVVQILGVAVSATHIYFKPELAQIELL